MVRESDCAAIPRPKDAEQIQPYLLRRTGVRCGALQYREWHLLRVNSLDGAVNLVESAHATRQDHRPARAKNSIEHRRVRHLTRCNLPRRDTQTVKQFHGFERE